MSGAVPAVELLGATRRFGGLVAVNGVDLAVAPGTIHGVIGPNGAGKSTTFDLISGLTRVSAGTIRVGGRDVTSMPVAARVAIGICRTFQTSRLFEGMTVLETVMTGRHRHGRTGIFGSMFGILGKRADEEAIRAEAMRLVVLLGLADDRNAPVSTLSYGRRRLVEIARALATGPTVLLLDEVASGLTPAETEALATLIRRLAGGGLTVMLVEHDMPFVMGLCERITVLNFGARIADGTPREICDDPAVIEAYLGRPRDAALSRRAQRLAARAAPVPTPVS